MIEEDRRGANSSDQDDPFQGFSYEANALTDSLKQFAAPNQETIDAILDDIQSVRRSEDMEDLSRLERWSETHPHAIVHLMAYQYDSSFSDDSKLVGLLKKVMKEQLRQLRLIADSFPYSMNDVVRAVTINRGQEIHDADQHKHLSDEDLENIGRFRKAIAPFINGIFVDESKASELLTPEDIVVIGSLEVWNIGRGNAFMCLFESLESLDCEQSYNLQLEGKVREFVDRNVGRDLTYLPDIERSYIGHFLGSSMGVLRNVSNPLELSSSGVARMLMRPLSELTSLRTIMGFGSLDPCLKAFDAKVRNKIYVDGMCQYLACAHPLSTKTERGREVVSLISSFAGEEPETVFDLLVEKAASDEMVEELIRYQHHIVGIVSAMRESGFNYQQAVAHGAHLLGKNYIQRL